MRAARSVLAVVTMIGLLASCGGGSSSAKVPAESSPSSRALTVYAIGGSATEGDGVPDRLRDAWPYLVFHNAFPASTVFVNGALDNATVRNAIGAQVPLAAQLKPDVVEVWLGADDLVAATPIPEFTSNFTELISALQSAGAGRIIVADLPRAFGAAVPAYNAAIHTVVSRAHVELVPLASAGITLVPTDGLPQQPDAASHKLIAAAFEKEIARRR